MPFRRSLAAGLVLAALMLVANSTAHAQNRAPAKPGAQAAAGELGKRLGRIEEQLTDLQVAIGALESRPGGTQGQSAAPEALPWAANTKTTSAQASAPSGDTVLRLSAVETQIRALTGEVERIAHSMRRIRAHLNLPDDVLRGSATPPASGLRRDPGTGFVTPRAGDAQSPHGARTRRRPRDILGAERSLGRFSNTPVPGLQQPGTPAQSPGRKSAANARTTDAARTLYESGYGAYLRGDSKSAIRAFGRFLADNPKDVLAGNAQYWLGEAHFAQGQYKKAADAFLKGYTTYADSTKAPDSLLKLGMSLDRLKQHDAACATFGELASKFPKARQNVLDRARLEARRAKCR